MNEIQNKKVATICLASYLLLYNISFLIVLWGYYEPFCYPDTHLLWVRFIFFNVALPLTLMVLWIDVHRETPSVENKKLMIYSIVYCGLSILTGGLFTVYYHTNKDCFACAKEYDYEYLGGPFKSGKFKLWWLIFVLFLGTIISNILLLSELVK